MNSLRYYRNSLRGYWPTARALSSSSLGAARLFFALLSIPVLKHISGRHPRKLLLSIDGQTVPFFVRDGTDISALREIFADGEYLFDELSRVSPRHIADIGAHIGTSVLFLRSRYPDAVITAYEPDPENFQLLAKNVGALPKVECVNAAVAGRAGTISFYPNAGGSTRASIIPMKDSRGEIQVSSILLDDVISRGIDMIKFDIEGAENEMFAAATMIVGLSIGEVHHKLIGKTREQFGTLFPGCSFTWKERGSDHSIVAISRQSPA
ncbi:MAG: FkbM family methyltransferase [Candidatus Parcubacteria bacterium]|nr:FkbM family methyltransferase [Candidatus Parcubacteria bacterium]